MHTEYGPPGHRGVTQIMGLADDAVAVADGSALAKLKTALPQSQPLKTAGGLAIAAWIGGMLLGNDTLKNMGIGAGMAVLATQHLTAKEETAKTIEVIDATLPIPPTLNGWG